MLEVHTLTVGLLQENCHLLADSETRQALLLEPGDKAERLIAALAGFKLTAIWPTHAHFDHIGVLAEVYRQFLVLVYLHEDNREFNHAATSRAFFGLVVEQPVLGTATADSRSDSDFGYTRGDGSVYAPSFVTEFFGHTSSLFNFRLACLLPVTSSCTTW